jgi:hypothetical protein
MRLTLLARGDTVIVTMKSMIITMHIKAEQSGVVAEKYNSTGRLSVYRGDICDEALVKGL